MVQNVLGQQDEFAQYVQLPFPYYTLTREQENRIASLQNEIGCYVDMQIARWVLGEEEITDDAFIAFETKLQELGLNEFLAFWQEVLDQL